MRKLLLAAVLIWTILALAGAQAEGAEFQTVYFGSYEQDGDTENGAEPIEWLVLQADGDWVTLISRYVLDASVYDTEDSYVYGDGELRRWLNEDFLPAAFTPDEAGRLRSVAHECEVFFSGGDSSELFQSEDRVNALTREEAETLLPENTLRQAQPTPYAVSRGVWVQDRGTWQGNCLYWLWEGGDYGAEAVNCRGDFVYVFSESEEEIWVERFGLPIDSPYAGVRPVVVARLPQSEYPRGTLTLTGSSGPASFCSDDLVQFGWYEQNGEDYYGGPTGRREDYVFGGGEPLLWEVLEESEDQLLLISQCILRLRPYDEFGGEDWNDSTVRRWLNTCFLECAFPEEERDLMVARRNADGVSDTVFLPTREEALRAIGEGWDPRTGCTDLALCWTAYASCVVDWGEWWLSDGTIVPYNGKIPVTQGEADGEEDERHDPWNIGVRPVIALSATREELKALAETVAERADRRSMPHPDLPTYDASIKTLPAALREGPGPEYAEALHAGASGTFRCVDLDWRGSDGRLWLRLDGYCDGRVISGFVAREDMDDSNYSWETMDELNSPVKCVGPTRVYAAPSVAAAERDEISADTSAMLLYYDGDHAMIEYDDQNTGTRHRGFVLSGSIADE